ncbi:Rab family, other [Angomonas deanei]|uniref:ADP-ribosylation factor family/Ras of Complex, Roc, domain of DAPkinase/Ras family, putative n=1 Tax=Angomonas deanei TaxID=59799 RepID=S9VEE0_9TRYP|nr:Rab family, other [Angomonas deanei]EPY43136.1 Rab family, other [Angomonas deanei]EPY43836.1 Rab family, other [Angomonas deanei]CAD2213442.1 ADP-ribosylation factor family/Ras of Complex, Roc, domain of DAPkinase/Ras family, putative [Angomonas deanei]|eukprot:EPY39394.1 Rab family, other [Angomonas deanei]
MVLLRLRIAVVGEPTSGKTAYVQMVNSEGVTFPKDYLMTMGCDFVVKEVPLNEEDVVEVTLMDIGGQKLYDRMVPAYMENVTAYFLMYDVSNKTTFETCKKWVKRAQAANKEMIGVLIANKMDLADKCEITDSQGESFAKANNMRFYKCSALRGTGINEPIIDFANFFLEGYRQRIAEMSQ